MSRRLLNIFYPFSATKQFIEGSQLSVEKYEDFYDIRSNDISSNSLQYTSYYINRYLVELLEEITKVVEGSNESIEVIVPMQTVMNIESVEDTLNIEGWK